MNPDQLQALLAQLLGYAQPPMPQSALPSADPSAASAPVYPGTPQPSTVPPGTGQHATFAPGSGGVGPGNQGAGGHAQQFEGDTGKHPLRAAHARLLQLLLHGTKPITHRQHLTLRALRANTALPGTKKYRQQQNPTYGAPSSNGGPPQRQRRQRTFGPGMG